LSDDYFFICTFADTGLCLLIFYDW
jgi:hypothetical protein